MINTNENWLLINELFNGKLKIMDTKPNIALPKVILNETGCTALAECEKIMTLKAFAYSTIKAYKSELVYFFKYFEQRELQAITKSYTKTTWS